MKVSIKDLNVDMDIKNSGIELDIYSPDGATHHGDLYVTKTGLIWCKGQITRPNGKNISWGKFMEWAQAQ